MSYVLLCLVRVAIGNDTVLDIAIICMCLASVFSNLLQLIDLVYIMFMEIKLWRITYYLFITSASLFVCLNSVSCKIIDTKQSQY